MRTLYASKSSGSAACKGGVIEKKGEQGYDNTPAGRAGRKVLSFRRAIDPPFSGAGGNRLPMVFRRTRYLRWTAAVTVTCDRG